VFPSPNVERNWVNRAVPEIGSGSASAVGLIRRNVIRLAQRNGRPLEIHFPFRVVLSQLRLILKADVPLGGLTNSFSQTSICSSGSLAEVDTTTVELTAPSGATIVLVATDVPVA
jgi:hypothetical protein